MPLFDHETLVSEIDALWEELVLVGLVRLFICTKPSRATLCTEQQQPSHARVHAWTPRIVDTPGSRFLGTSSGMLTSLRVCLLQ